MTAEEWAEQLDERLCAEFDHWLSAAAVDATAEAIEQAVAEEHEACARALEQSAINATKAGVDVAALWLWQMADHIRKGLHR